MEAGADLRAARYGAGLSQRELARRAGLSHKVVQYWEGRPKLDRFAFGVRAIFRALAITDGELRNQYAPARGGVLDAKAMERLVQEYAPGMSKSLRRHLTHRRVVCGAKTRKGNPCRAKSEPGRDRCRFHGGLSTGPKTDEGRARISTAQKVRWAAYRLNLGGQKGG